MKIDDYVRSSRRQRATPVDLSDYYRHWYDLIKSHLRVQYEFPELYVSYSTDRRCECVNISSRRYVVYDQYLGQTFARLARILYTAKAPEVLSMSYAYKYLAERCSALGDPALGAYFALAHRLILGESTEDLWNISGNASRRRSIVVAQECFVIAHEVNHILYSSSSVASPPGQKAIDVAWDYVLQVLHQYQHIVPEHDASYRELSQRYGDEHAQFLRDEANNQVWHGRQVSELVHGEKAKLSVEVACDVSAASIAFQIAQQTLHLLVEDAAASVLLAIRNLRLFEHLDYMAAKSCALNRVFREGGRPSTKQIKSILEARWDEYHDIIRAQIRERVLRRMAHDFFSLFYGDGGARKLHTSIADVLDEYDLRIEFPVTLHVTDRIFGFMKDLASNGGAERYLRRSLPSGTKFKPVEMVDQLTGWTEWSPEEFANKHQ